MESYGERVGKIVNSTLVGVALSMSKDVGILQVLLEAQQPLTSVQIADMKQLKERYVRELLCCLATAEILHATINEEGSLVYSIEEEEKKVFKSLVMTFISIPPLLPVLFPQIRGCLSISGPNGVRYSEATHVFIDELSFYNMNLYIENILQNVDGLKEKLENGIEVIEFGCGKEARLLARFAQMFPKSTFVASEVVPSFVDQLKVKLGHIPNIRYEINDLCSLPDPPTKQYDWIYSVNVIHDLPNPPEALKAIRKLLKEPTGIFTMIEPATSGSPIDDKGKLDVASFYVVSTFFCIPESYQRDDSQALGTCWGRKTATSLAEAAGFNVKYIDIGHNFAIFSCTP